MHRAFFAFVLLFVALGAACSGGNSSSSQPTPRPTATAQPSSNEPAASVLPRSVPPGAQVTVSGTGWPAGESVVVTGTAEPGTTVTRPFATTTVGPNGTFTVQFLIEKTATGAELPVGRYDLVATAGSINVVVPLQVENRRPLTPADRGAGG